MKKAQTKLMWLVTGLLFSSATWAEYGLNLRKGVTDFSETAFELHMIAFWICVVIGIVVFGAMLYSVIVHRKSKGVTPAQFSHSTAAEILWTIIPIVILAAIAWPATKALIQMENPPKKELELL